MKTKSRKTRNNYVSKQSIKIMNKIAVRMEYVMVVVFLLACAFYSFSKIGLNSYNLTLQMESQKLSREIMVKQQSVNELSNEIHRLEDKARVMDIVGSDVSDKQSNVYIVH